MPITVGAYTRISDDGEGDAKGVARQKSDTFSLCALRRWKPVLYEENDTSAYRREVRREAFEQMLSDLESGVIQGVAVYNLDRLARQPRDLERLIDIYDRRPGLVFATLEGDINLANSDGRTMARVMVAFANKSSADTGRRIKRKQLELASEGKFHGGRIPWGWQADGVTVDPKAKEEILKGHQALLEGARVADIRADWEKRGIAPLNRHGERYKSKGDQVAKRLYHHTVVRVLTNPALAGVKVYNGEVVRGEDGQPIRAAWKPICSQGQLDAVVATLEERKGPARHIARRYLLSGIATCGGCASPLRGSTRKHRDKVRQYAVYQCDTHGGGCGKITRVAEPIEELVIALTLEEEKRRLGAPEVAPGWTREGELQLCLKEIDELHAAKKAREISVSSLIRSLRPLEEERDRLLAEKRRLEAAAIQQEAMEIEGRDAFDALPLDTQRAMILKTVQAVIVHPAKARGARFDPSLIEPVPAD
ncbi:recombinase family protein [Streptomyces nodosus]|uniref:recombinase family protein n=1 Tax=Streptomyces nodosus TaxID=40318 RepID=UPI0034571EA6